MDQSTKPATLKEWGAALKALRVKANLTQPYVCQKTGAAGTAVYRWEAGKVRPQLRFLPKLRKLFPELPPLPLEADASSDVERLAG
jgi:transcriptional regulator with XRE-family HTH domain